MTSRNRSLRRALLLLSILSDGAIHERRALAARLGVCCRTVRRDVDALDEVGFAIEPETLDGVHGAYQLVNPQAVQALVSGESLENG